MAEREPPGAEHGARDLVALLERRGRVVEQPAPIEPGHGQQPLGGQLRHNLGHADQRIVLEDEAVEPHVPGFEIVVELLAQPRRDLLQHLGGLDRRAHAAHGSRTAPRAGRGRLRPPTACPDIAAWRRARARHGSSRDAPGRARPTPPPHARSSRTSLPSRAQAPPPCAAARTASPSAAPDSGAGRARRHIRPASASGMVASSCATFMIGPFRPPSAAASAAASLPRLGLEPEQAPSGDARRHTADIGADLAVAQRAGAEPVLLLIGRAVVHGRQRFTCGKGSPHIGARPALRPPARQKSEICQ